MKREHFAPVDEWWDNRVEIKDEKTDDSQTETWKSKKYTINEIEARNYDIDLCGYPVEEKIILSPKETMENYITKRAELDEKMDKQIAEIMAMLED